MPDSPKYSEVPPVIFLAFANHPPTHHQYLRNLPIEHAALKKELEALEDAGHCRLVVEPFATAERIFDTFQKKEYKDRIAVFHFAGHANGYELLTETWDQSRGKFDRISLTDFLGRRNHCLKLVFLNGCCTQPHAEALRKAGVPVVISTYGAVRDDVACKMAERFYHGFANDLPIEQAWLDAENFIQGMVSDMDKTNGKRIIKPELLFRELYVTPDKKVSQFPWDIKVKTGAEHIKGWNLSDASNDSSFGLPPVLQTCQLPEEPYRYLRPYLREHAEIYFGRGRDIKSLNKKIHALKQQPVILLFGQSGVGKSSLLAAGLLPRLENAYYRRRDQEKGLLGTLVSVLNEAANKNQLQLSELEQQSINAAGNGVDSPILSYWHAIEEKANQPLIVIIDQAEEALTRPNPAIPDELETFAEVLTLIFGIPKNYPRGKLIIGYREEYHPKIEDLFKEKGLPRQDHYLAPMSKANIIEVVKGLAGPHTPDHLKSKYCLSLKKDEDLPSRIANDLLEDSKSAIAPMLQIILTRLWELVKGNKKERELSEAMYLEKIKSKGIAMADFLRLQLDDLQKEHPEWVESGLALDVLLYHTTDANTADICTLDDIKHDYFHCQEIEQLIGVLQDRYLLTAITNATPGKAPITEMRLAHDTLGPEVRKAVDTSNKPAQRAMHTLNNKLRDIRSGIKGAYLGLRELVSVKKARNTMRTLSEDAGNLLTASQKHLLQVWVTVALLVLITTMLGYTVFQNYYEKRNIYDDEVSKMVDKIERIGLYATVGKYRINADGREHLTHWYGMLASGQVVYDSVTCLIWQQSGSHDSMTFDEAQSYIADLNTGNGYGGLKNWRLPNWEEGISLIKYDYGKDEYFLDSLFDSRQAKIWTDSTATASQSRTWVVDYPATNLDYIDKTRKYYVRAVRESSHPREKPFQNVTFGVKRMLREHNYFDANLNTSGQGIENDYSVSEDSQVVYDRKTKLFWQRSGSKYYLNWHEAQNYIADSLNAKNVGGFSDWRLPTLAEAMSLMERERKNGNLYIDPLFDPRPSWIWTANRYSASDAWLVNFNVGYCYSHRVDVTFYARAVRS